MGATACAPLECDRAAAGSFQLRFEDPQGDLPDFGAHPWPSDALKRANGTLRLDHFPNPTESSTLDDYLRVIANETSAYATHAAAYLAFSEPLDPGSLPADPAATLQAGASLKLVDIDPDSPQRGRQIPLQLRASEQAALHLPKNHLIALPVYGSGLRSDTTYALLLSPQLRSTSQASLSRSSRLHAALTRGCQDSVSGALYQAFEPLRRFVEDGLAQADELAGATVYTTQPAVAEVRRLGEAARAQPVPEPGGWDFVGSDGATFRLRAELDLPGFQQGEVPYQGIEDGGGLRTDAQGAYVLDHQERTRIGVALPQSSTMPAEGWPVVLYSHGTGGDYSSGFSSAVARRLAAKGVALVGYDQTLHGPRDPTGSDPSLTFFNLFNPLAARDNVRQGVADLVVMTSVIEAMRIPASATRGQGEVRFDPSRIAFVGHSQGSLVGAPFAAVDPRIKGHVFSGLGAVLTVTLLERKDIVNFKALLESLLAYPEGTELDEMDPVLNLIQTFIEPADPIAYAASYLADPPGGFRSDILQVEGFLDFASPARGQEAFATAAGLPVIAPLHRLPEAAALLGPDSQSAPARANVSSASGPVTFGLIQYPEETHFPIFDSSDANARFIEFVRAVLKDGRGVIPGP